MTVDSTSVYALDNEPPDFPALAEDATPREVVARIEAAGLVGMGGGGYPTAKKIRAAMANNTDVVIANGMASEPRVTADTRLLRDHFGPVAAGLELVSRCLGRPRAVLAVPPGSALAPPVVEVNLPYPAGDERLLTRHLTGRNVPAGGYPTDVGVLVLNVATLFAVYEAVVLGRRPRRRMVTLAGQDRWLPIGLPLGELGLGPGRTGDGARAKSGAGRTAGGRSAATLFRALRRACVPRSDPPGLRVGGPLTGVPATEVDSVQPTTISVDKGAGPPHACIRCGRCTPACPADLEPDFLFAGAEREEADADVLRCIECGACTQVCPSGIDLVNAFRDMKRQVALDRARQSQAAAAKARFQARERRLAALDESQQQRRAERLRSDREW